MKLKLSLLLLLLPVIGFGQCTPIDKCVNSAASATAINVATGLAFDVSVFTVAWSSTLPGFVPPSGNVNRIDWATVGNTVGAFTVTFVVDDGSGCSKTVTCTINVIDGTATFTPPIICNNPGTCVTASGGVPAGGIYSIGGATVTQFCAADIGSPITYTVVNANGCGGTATSNLAGKNPPNANIQLN